MTRVLLIDDHAALREPLGLLLEREPDLTVVGQAGSLAEARRLLADGLVADVAVVDLNLPDGSGIDLIRELRAANPEGAVLVLTASGGERDRARAVQAGAMGVLNEATLIAEVIVAVRGVAEGKPLLPPAEVIRLLRSANEQLEDDRDARATLHRLTQREREVLQALGEGLSDKEIALRLSISSKTVRVYMANLLTKLGQESRLQAVLFAACHGAIDIR